MNLEIFRYKNILITGAGSGIGKAIAYRLADAAPQLVLAGRNAERLNAVNDKCTLKGSGSSFYITDFASTDSIDRFTASIKDKNIVFDYIFLNAGVSQRALTLETDMEVDRRIMEVNYFGPVRLIKNLAGDLTNRPVHIAVTSSISGLFGFPLRSAYCASKHALFGFFESLELENENIKVTFLIPGRINTPISKSAILKDGSAYNKTDRGQAQGMDAGKCARIALKAVIKGKRRRLIGGKELLMVYIKKYMPSLFYKLARQVSAT
jgi:short-subunit dehydrogenase